MKYAQFTNQRTQLTNQQIHAIAVKNSILWLEHGDLKEIINGDNLLDYCCNESKAESTDPDLYLDCYCGNSIRTISFRAVGDSHLTSLNFFLDLRCLNPTSDYIAYSLNNQHLLYIIPSKKLADWLMVNKDDKNKARPYKDRVRNIDGYIVNRKLLCREIPEIQRFPMN